MADTVLTELKIHEFDSLGQMSQYESEIGNNDLVFTPDLSCRLPLLAPMWFDHITNDISWLRADTFSWQSGDTYKAAYEHLVADCEIVVEGVQYYAWRGNNFYYFTATSQPSIGDTVYIYYSSNNTVVVDDYAEITAVSDSGITIKDEFSTATYTRSIVSATQTETIGDITITFYRAEDGHKICLPDQESNIVALYEKTGAADYYILDTTNKQFKLPRKQKRTLIQAVKNDDGTWYNLYSDGWVEQGGKVDIAVPTTTITLPVEMADTNYTVLATAYSYSSPNFDPAIVNIRKDNTKTATSFKLMAKNHGGNSYATTAFWQVSGMAAESAYASAGMRLEYYYVGNFEQSAIEQTAGITAETLNGKADTDLGNIPTNYDYVVESQLPTADNGYTWYRKYKSGWVEQGGSPSVTGSASVTLPIAMTDTNYTVSGTYRATNLSNSAIAINPASTTNIYVNAQSGFYWYWQVSGMAAE